MKHGHWYRAVASLVIIGVLSGFAATGWAAAARTFPGSGIYRVGKDIAPGTYRSRGGDGCYWARLRSFGGDLNSILANTTADGPTLVTLRPTDRGFETRRCGTWTSSLVRITRSKTRFGPGTFVVGVDIAPGTYRSNGRGDCYWARLRSFTGDLNSILANSNTSGPTIVSISAGDRGFQSTRCGTWTRL
jgi:hypothetical protein